MGAGSGRFAYHFIDDLRKISAGRPLHFRYVLTDFTEASVESWRQHPQLRALEEEGRLEVRRFDAIEADLPWQGFANPCIVLANYFFDSIPQDAFAVREGVLCERLPVVASSQKESDVSDPDVLTRISVRYTERPTATDYYADADWNAILKQYSRLEGAEFSFPTSGLRLMDSFRRSANDRLLFIASDSGPSTLSGVSTMRGPMVNMHGSFSLETNLHALGEYISMQGGTFLHTGDRHGYLNVSSFLTGRPPDGYIRTRAAFEAEVDGFGPDDFFVFKRSLDEAERVLPLREALAVLRLSRWDPETLGTLFNSLINALPEADEGERDQLRLAVERVWRAYFPIGEETDVAFRLAMILFGIGDFGEALLYFQRSIELCGEHAATLYNMALCHLELEQRDRAFVVLERAIQLDPQALETRELQQRLSASA